LRLDAGVVFAAVFGLVLLLVLLGIARAQRFKAELEPGDQLGSMVFEGRKRTFLVHKPLLTGPAPRRPLVVVLHGGGGTGRAVAQLTGFSALADSAGFVVVYPYAVNGHWNDGRNVPQFRSQRENVNDVGFIAALIDSLVEKLNVDPKRVYATGMSNGAIMCYRLAGELSEKIAAIAPVAGALAEPYAGTCRPSRPVSVLALNGTEDRLVPYEGGEVGLFAQRGRVISVAKTIEFWVKANDCSAEPVVSWIDADPNDGVRIKQEVYAGGRDGSEVILYTVVGGGHTWPAGAVRPRRFGRRAQDLDATRVIWEFCRRHQR